MPWIAHAPTPRSRRHFVGIAVLKRRPTMLWLYVLQGQACLSLGLFPALCSNFCLEKRFLRCLLRFWFGGNLERELGEVFSPPQFTARASEVSTKDFFCMCVCIRRWQAAPSFFFFFLLLEGLPLIGMGLACVSHPTFFLIFSLNPFANLLVMVWKWECHTVV